MKHRLHSSGDASRLASRLLRRRLAFAVLLAAAGSAPAQQLITNVGLVDLQAVTTAYFRESTAVRDLYAERDRVQAERGRLEARILELEARRLRAQQEGREQEALRIGDQVFTQKQHLRDFVSVMNRQLSHREALLAESDEFLGELADAIEYVAESRGLSLVLDKNNVTLLYFLPEIEITEAVIAELGRRVGRN
ncbi:MAG: OmpH family outer membrane protein [Spirochaetaceae bacterium]|nr:OmpH family outer membrane protein [Spirochaetaceae bacterium]MDE0229908.1 OmpH family outer membrane protein [Spirochaetaceae bacterium]MDE0447264.1 OmpH family outer membrane protein [Spirochaetaceae bacterium]